MGDLLSIGEFARQIDDRDIDIVAQPIVDLVRGTVVGYEALARFPTTNGLGVEGWFELADRSGLGHRLRRRRWRMPWICGAICHRTAS